MTLFATDQFFRRIALLSLCMFAACQTSESGSVTTPNSDVDVDTDAPTVALVSSSTDDGAYKADQTIAVQVIFSESVIVLGTPVLTLETGGTDALATYTSGSGSPVLSFSYVVQNGDTSEDLNYVAVDSLSTESGSIRDTASNDANLTLPDVASELSLAANKALIIDTTPPTSASVVIDEDADYTTNTSVILTLSAIEAAEMLVSSDSDCSTGLWINYDTSSDYTLPSENATNTVYVQFRDDAFNLSECVSDSIVHDTIAPSIPGSVVDGTTSLTVRSPTITWAASTDSGSGISEYQIAIGTSAGTGDVVDWVSVGTSLSASLIDLSLTQSSTYYTSVRAVDNAGNTSSVGLGDGWIASDVPNSETLDAWAHQAFIKPSNLEGFDEFGTAVAIYNNTIAVGAPNESGSQLTVTNGTDIAYLDADYLSGAAYVFIQSGGVWSQQAYIKPPNNRSTAAFGSSVAIDKDTLVVGAPEEASDYATICNGAVPPYDADHYALGGAGAAYVFVRSGSTWSYQSFLKASNVDAGDNFGSSVAIASDTILVAAMYEDSAVASITYGTPASTDNSSENAGAVYVFGRTGTTWTEQAVLKATNAEADDQFGTAIAISADTVVVSAVHESSNQLSITNGSTASINNDLPYSGAAYVYVRTGTTWSQQAFLKAPNAISDALFGGKVAIDQDTLVVTSSREANDQSSVTNGTGASTNGAADGSGAAFVFVRTGSTWGQQAYLKASNNTSEAQFGTAVGISQDRIIVGAIREASNESTITLGTSSGSNSGLNESGAIYAFVRSGSTWRQEAFIKAPNARESTGFSQSAALHRNILAVGAPLEPSGQTSITNGTTSTSDDSQPRAGAVYVIAY